MTALFVVLGILIFIFILLMIPVSGKLIYDENTTLKIRYLFLTFQILPQKVKKKKKKKSKTGSEKKAEKKENTFLKLIKKDGIDGLIEILQDIVNIILNVLKSTSKHLTISKLNVSISVGGNDAAETAMNFGYACSGIYPLISVIDSNVKKCRHSENITADFNSKETKINCTFNGKIKLLFLIGILVSAAVKAIKTIAKWQ